MANEVKADGGALSAEGKTRLRVKRKAAGEITDEQLATTVTALGVGNAGAPPSASRVVTS